MATISILTHTHRGRRVEEFTIRAMNKPEMPYVLEGKGLRFYAVSQEGRVFHPGNDQTVGTVDLMACAWAIGVTFPGCIQPTGMNTCTREPLPGLPYCAQHAWKATPAARDEHDVCQICLTGDEFVPATGFTQRGFRACSQHRYEPI